MSYSFRVWLEGFKLSGRLCGNLKAFWINYFKVVIQFRAPIWPNESEPQIVECDHASYIKLSARRLDFSMLQFF